MCFPQCPYTLLCLLYISISCFCNFVLFCLNYWSVGVVWWWRWGITICKQTKVWGVPCAFHSALPHVIVFTLHFHCLCPFPSVFFFLTDYVSACCSSDSEAVGVAKLVDKLRKVWSAPCTLTMAFHTFLCLFYIFIACLCFLLFCFVWLTGVSAWCGSG